MILRGDDDLIDMIKKALEENFIDKKYEDIRNQWMKRINTLEEVAHKCELNTIFEKF